MSNERSSTSATTGNVVAASSDVSPVPAVFQNLFRDFARLACGAVISALSVFILTLALVRIIGRGELGAYGLVQGAATVLATGLMLGLDNTLMIESGKARHKDSRHLVSLAFVYLGVVLILTTVLILLDRPGPNSLTMADLSPDAGVLVGAVVISQTLLCLWGSMLRGLDRFRDAVLLVQTSQVALAAGAITGGWLTRTYVGALWGGIIAVSCIGLWFVLHEIHRHGIVLPSVDVLKTIGSGSGFRTYLIRIAESVSERFGILYLAALHDLPGIAAVVACQQLASVISKPAATASALISGKVAGQPSSEEHARKVLQIARLTFLMSLASALPLLVMPHFFVDLLLGPEFFDVIPVFLFFVLSEAVRGHASTAAGLLVAQGCPFGYVLLKIAVLLLTIVGVITLAERFGPAGVAAVQCVLSFLQTVGIAGLVALQARNVWAIFQSNDLVLIGKALGATRNRC